MNPRLKTSQKWTSFPEELLTQIQGALVENLGKYSPAGSFCTDGRIYPKEVLFKIGHTEKDNIVQNNIWVSIDYDTKKDNVKNTLNLVIDCASSLMAHFFENPKEEFPRAWATFNFEKKDMYICLDKSNDDLEAQANALLGETDDQSLVHETTPEEDQ